MAEVVCAICGADQTILDGTISFRCRQCRTNTRFVTCRRCSNAFAFVGDGTGYTKCPNCRKTNQVPPLAAYRQVNSMAREAHRAQQAYERAKTADERERKRLYAESRTAEAAAQNEALSAQLVRLQGLLAESLAVDDFIDFEMFKEQPSLGPFEPGALGVAAPPPHLDQFMPEDLSAASRLVPGAKSRHERAVAEARSGYQAAIAEWEAAETNRQTLLDQASRQHESKLADEQAELARHNKETAARESEYIAGERDAVTWYCSQVLDASSYPEDFPKAFRVAFVPESRQLVVEYQLPSSGVIPEAATVKYVKVRDAIESVTRPPRRRESNSTQT